MAVGSIIKLSDRGLEQGCVKRVCFYFKLSFVSSYLQLQHILSQNVSVPNSIQVKMKLPVHLTNGTSVVSEPKKNPYGS